MGYPLGHTLRFSRYLFTKETQLKSLDPKTFLTDHWQKSPLFLPHAIDEACPTLTGNELAWLAIQPDVESRLVFTDRGDGRTSYRLETGPFEEAYLGQLPDKDWTLLVQDVEKHLPDFRAWLGHAEFIPDWRIDDLMVSFAAPGGSVGPHLDNYDVFLCQGEGTREWRTGDIGTALPDELSDELSLLQPFPVTASHKASQGDVLYLPPGIPHWGIAQDFCVTYSIGMRAPTKAELMAGADRIFDSADNSPPPANDSEIFYCDMDLGVNEAIRGCISGQTVRRVHEQGLLDESLSSEEIALVFGSVVTDPKAWLLADPADPKVLDETIQCNSDIPVHGMAQIAWYHNLSLWIVFANGLALKTSSGNGRFMQDICGKRVAKSPAISSLCAQQDGREFFEWLLEQGVFDVGHNS